MKRKVKKVRRVVLGAGYLSGGEFYAKYHKDKSWAGGGYYSSRDHIAIDCEKLNGKRIRLVAEVIGEKK